MASWQQTLVVGAALLFAVWLLVKLARGPGIRRTPDAGALEAFRQVKARIRKVSTAAERATVLIEAGDLARDRLHRLDLGVAHYLRALRHDPTNQLALDSVREALILQRNWRRLERAYWKLLARLPRESPLVVNVLSHLADLYAGPFRHPTRAMAIRRLAERLGP